MKRFFLTVFLIASTAFAAFAQNVQQTVVTESASVPSDITELGTEVLVDSTLIGRDIFSLLPEDMVVMQGGEVRQALNNQILKNEGRVYSGFRIRIFIDSKRGAREASLAMLEKFNKQYPMVLAYRSYSAPNFKVSVGNFRNRVEAEAFLREIIADFPGAFIVRDRFKFPSLGAPEIPVVEE